MASADRPNQYSENAIPRSTEAVAVDFGFTASQVLLINDRGTSVFLDLTSSVGSTGKFEIKTNENVSFAVITSILSLACTATSTSTYVRTLALRT